MQLATMAAGMPRSLVVVLLILVSTAPVTWSTPYSDNLQDACNKTLFPKVCIHSLTTNPETRTADARRLAELSVYVAKEVGTTVAAFAHAELNGVKEDILFKCLDSCSDDIEEAVAHLSALTRELTDAKFLEIKSWLSATLGGTSTCEESCKDAPISDIKNAVVTKSLEFEKLLRVTLDLITEASGSMSADVAVPPTAWDASAPGGSYGAAAPEASFGAIAPESSEGAGAPGAEEPSTDSAPAPSIDSDAPSAEAPASSSGVADEPSPSEPSAEAPESGAAGAPFSSGVADEPSSSEPSAEAPESGAAGAPAESGAAGAPAESGAAGAPAESGAADAPAESEASGAPAESGAAYAPGSGEAGAPSPSMAAGAPEADSTA